MHDNVTLIKEASHARKLRRIEAAVGEIMSALGLDTTNDSLKDTPKRVAKMYVNEIFSGLHENISDKLKSFDNTYGYKGMVLVRDIPFHSMCEHHMLPIIGKAHVAYLPTEKVLGLSKFNRIVHHCSSRPGRFCAANLLVRSLSAILVSNRTCGCLREEQPTGMD